MNFTIPSIYTFFGINHGHAISCLREPFCHAAISSSNICHAREIPLRKLLSNERQHLVICIPPLTNHRHLSIVLNRTKDLHEEVAPIDTRSIAEWDDVFSCALSLKLGFGRLANESRCAPRTNCNIRSDPYHTLNSTLACSRIFKAIGRSHGGIPEKDQRR